MGRDPIGALRKGVTWLPDVNFAPLIFADKAAPLLAAHLHISRGI